MPARTAFDSAERHYGTFFHELTHCTGHASGLAARASDKLEQFGSELYSCEELTAEIGARCYVASQAALHKPSRGNEHSLPAAAQ